MGMSKSNFSPHEAKLLWRHDRKEQAFDELEDESNLQNHCNRTMLTSHQPISLISSNLLTCLTGRYSALLVTVQLQLVIESFTANKRLIVDALPFESPESAGLDFLARPNSDRPHDQGPNH